MKTRLLGDLDIRIAEIALRLRASTPNASDLLRAAVEEGVSYFQVESVERASLLRRTLGELRHHMLVGALSAPDAILESADAALARLGDTQLGVLWIKPASAEEPHLERALARVQSLQAARRINTFGFAISHLSADDQIAVGQWAIETAGTPLLQINYSLHEPRVGKELFPLAQDSQTCFMVALPKAMTTLDNVLGEELAHAVSTFARKTRQLRFLTESGRSLAQSAIKFALAQSSVVCVLPAISTLADLQWSIAASDAPDLTRSELNRLDDLATHGFHLKPSEPPSVYNG